MANVITYSEVLLNTVDYPIINSNLKAQVSLLLSVFLHLPNPHDIYICLIQEITMS